MSSDSTKTIWLAGQLLGQRGAEVRVGRPHRGGDGHRQRSHPTDRPPAVDATLRRTWIDPVREAPESGMHR